MRSMSKTAVREIKNTLGRFIAILAIIALGVGFFAGVRDTTPAMVSMMNGFFEEHEFYDYRIVSTLGWDEDSVEEFAELPNVRCAEGGMTVDVIFSSPQKNTDEFVLKTHMIPKNINTLWLCEGTLPTEKNQCAAENSRGYHIGDKLKVCASNDEDTLDMLGETEYTVTALVESSYYINHERGTTSIGNGSVSGFVYLPESAFDVDYYNEIFVKFDHDLPIYSHEYDSFMDAKTDEWEALSEEIAMKRYDDVVNEATNKLKDAEDELDEKRADGEKELKDAKKELDDADKELKNAKKELDDAKKKLDDGEKEIADSEKKLADGRKELDDAKITLEDSKAKLDESEEALTDGEAQLAEGETQLSEAWEGYYSGLAEFEEAETAFYDTYGEALAMIDYLPPEQKEPLIQGKTQLEETKKQLDEAFSELEKQQEEFDLKKGELESGRAEFNEGKAKYEQGLIDLEQAEADLKDGEKKLEDARKELEDGKKEYEDGLKEYEDGLKEYNDGLKEYEDGLKEFDEKISDAEAKIADAQEEIDDLKSPDTYLLDRNTNIGYALFENDSEIVEQVAKVFPIFFILVAALVCVTTMSRMVEEQRTQIGMLKALGYSEASIMGKFMFYSGSASIIGCIAGFATGTYLFPSIIWMTYKLMYVPIDIPYYFDLPLAVLSVIASLLCSLGTTWFSCRVELSETAAGLMRPKAPKAGKRVLLEYVPFVWNRLKFLHKVSVRNIFRYKGRFFMMMIGIGGCTALLLTGFGIKDSVAGFADTQFDEIQIADASVAFDSENEDKVRSLLDEKCEEYIMYRHSSWDLLYGSKVKSIDLEAVEGFDDIAPFMNFRDMKKAPLAYPQLGEALVSHSISERFGVKTGDEMTLRNSDMTELHLKVIGVFENHAYNFVYISAETFEAQTGERPELNRAFVNFPDSVDKGEASAELSGDKNILSAELYDNTKKRMADMMSSLDYIVLLVIVCAAALAFIVIYNLTNINITERLREIATIKVLGFFRRETSAYVLRENIVLTAAGIALGLGLGVLLHGFVISQIKVDVVDFGRVIFPVSYLYSIILTFLFNFLVNIFMEIKLEAINMAESLKSVD